MQTMPPSGLVEAASSNAASGASALVFGYIEGRAQEADLASYVVELTKLVLELQARLSQLEGAEKRARSSNARFCSSRRRTRGCASGFASSRLASGASSPSAPRPSN